MEAALQALEGFKRLMDGYGAHRYRAVATSAVREAVNADTFLDRVQVRTGLQVGDHRRVRREPPRLPRGARPPGRASGAVGRARAAGRGGRRLGRHHPARAGRPEVLGRLRPRVGAYAAEPGHWSGDQERRVDRCSPGTSATSSATSSATCRSSSAEYMIALGERRPVRGPGTGRGAGGGRPRGAPRRVHRVLRARREARRRGPGRPLRPVAGRRRDAGARAARVSGTAASRRRPRGITVPHGVAARGPAGRPGRRHGRADPTASPTSASRCWPARSRWARSTATTRATPGRWRSWPRACSTSCKHEHGLDPARPAPARGGGAAARHRRVRRAARAPQARAVPHPGLGDLRPLGRRSGRHRATWRGTTGAGCRRSRTCPTWRSTAPIASA